VQQGNIRSYTLQRKLAAGFKEHSLLSIYEFGLSLLRRVAHKEIVIAGVSLAPTPRFKIRHV
jgi:hypothetical protein